MSTDYSIATNKPVVGPHGTLMEDGTYHPRWRRVREVGRS